MDSNQERQHGNCWIYFEVANEVASFLRCFGVPEEPIQIDKSAFSLKGQLIYLKHRKEDSLLRDDIYVEAKSILNKLGLLDITHKISVVIIYVGSMILPYISSGATQLDWRCVA